MVSAKSVFLALAALPFSLQVSNDFESGWDQAAWPVYAPDCNQGGTVSLDSSTAHSGKNSMKVTSPGGYCGHIFFGTTNVPSGDVYVRVWLKATNALTSNHVSFITMPDTAQGSNKHLRIGGQNQILMYNRETDDATLPDLSPQGTASSKPLPAGSWQCFEYHLGTDGSIETWLNSQVIAGLTTANNPYASQWTRSSIIPKVSAVYFGWESYGGDSNTFWYDDVSIGSSRIGCAVSGTPDPTTTPGGNPTTLTTSTVPTTSTPPQGTVPLWGQCGGNNWTGGTVCISGTCKANGEWYSQCVP